MFENFISYKGNHNTNWVKECKVWSFCGGECSSCLLSCVTMYCCCRTLVFQRTLLLLSSRWNVVTQPRRPWLEWRKPTFYQYFRVWHLHLPLMRKPASKHQSILITAGLVELTSLIHLVHRAGKNLPLRLLEMLSDALLCVDAFWVLTPHNVAVGYQHFVGPCCLHPGWSKVLQNVGVLLQYYTAWQLGRHWLESLLSQKPKSYNVLFIYCRKFQIVEKIQNGTITETDFKKQRLYAAALQYEEENSWLKKSKQDLMFQPQDETLQR
jgi:hypothetical protein